MDFDKMESPFLTALNWIERQTHTRTNHAQMLVGLQEGLFLRDFVVKTKSVRVLEIGTFTGYSLACLAEGVRTCIAGGDALQPAGEQPLRFGRSAGVYVDAIEINKELDYIIYEGLERAGVGSLVKVFFGDAVELLSRKGTFCREECFLRNDDCGQVEIAERYDLIFIDADKRQYPKYYELVLPLVRPGGYILADNVAWYGKATEDVNLANHKGEHQQPRKADSGGGKKEKTAGIVEFNSIVEKDSRVEATLMDIRDGLYIIRRK